MVSRAAIPRWLGQGVDFAAIFYNTECALRNSLHDFFSLFPRPYFSFRSAMISLIRSSSKALTLS